MRGGWRTALLPHSSLPLSYPMIRGGAGASVDAQAFADIVWVFLACISCRVHCIMYIRLGMYIQLGRGAAAGRGAEADRGRSWEVGGGHAQAGARADIPSAPSAIGAGSFPWIQVDVPPSSGIYLPKDGVQANDRSGEIRIPPLGRTPHCPAIRVFRPWARIGRARIPPRQSEAARPPGARRSGSPPVAAGLRVPVTRNRRPVDPGRASASPGGRQWAKTGPSSPIIDLK